MRISLGILVIMLAGCATVKPVYTPSEVKTVVDQCIESTGAPGGYSVFPGQHSTDVEGALPRADAVKALGGTEAGRAAVNACIKRKARADGLI